MRTSAALWLLIALAGCPSDVDRGYASEGDTGTDNGGGNGEAPTSSCVVDDDCTLAGPRCCDCPTHAVRADDPAALACTDVACAPTTCGSPTRAACVAGRCDLVCSPIACDADAACPTGFAVDGNGCLTCACAAATDAGECAVDADCVRVRADCCGCDEGGTDTSVPVALAASHEAALMCPASPVCPGGNLCAPDLTPRCVQGTCSLVEGALPPTACGRADLPACPAGQHCTVNASDPATMQGVGVCEP